LGNKKEGSFRHLGLGLPSHAAVKSAVDRLISLGAVVVRKNDDDTKFFLKLNPGDLMEIEIFLGDAGLSSIHFDKSINDLNEVSLDELTACSVPNMFFSPIFTDSVKTLEIEMAFYIEPFDWIPWIPKIEDAYKGNDPLEIDIPEEEWDRLSAETEEAQSLKDRLSSGAASLIHLIDDGSRTYVLLARICGRCQSC